MFITTTLGVSSLLYIILAKLHKNFHKSLIIKTKNNIETTEANPKLSLTIHKDDKDDTDYKLNRDLSIATAALITSAGGLFYAPLNIVSIPGIVWVSAVETRDAYRAYQQGRGLGADALAAIFEIGAILTGNYFAAAFGASFGRLSKKLLSKTEDKSKQSLINIFSNQNRTVSLLKNNVELETTVDHLNSGDVIIVHTGETIVVDGQIVSGIATIDQHILTGEAQPVEKGIGEPVFASTVVLSGKINIQVEKAGHETIAEQIGHILNHTADFKKDILSHGEKVADNSARLAMGLSAVTLPFFGATISLTVLNSSFGFYMRVLGPISMLTFLNIAAQRGLLIKDGRSLQLLNQVDIVVFDKTGTLTLEQPHVSCIHSCQGIDDNKLLTYAAAAESKQSHPIALAIREAAQQRDLQLPEINDPEYAVGYGLKVTLAGQQVRLGSQKFMQMEGIPLPDDIMWIYQQGYEQSYSFVFVAVDEQLWGIIELQATIRPETKKVIRQLQQRGLSTYIISGDQQKPTQQLAQEVGIEHYFAETLPENKAKLIEQLQSKGKSVCFVGDGINDSIALKKANVSISLRGASTVATDTAQIVLMHNNLNQLIQAFDVAKDFDNNMQLNTLTTILPGVITLYGAFFLKFGVLSSVILNDMGVVIGASNAILPWLKEQSKRQNQSLLNTAKNMLSGK